MARNKITATEAADALATQVVVAAKRHFKFQLEQGVPRGEIKLDGKLMIAQIMSEASHGHMGSYLRACTEATAPRTVAIHVRRQIKGA